MHREINVTISELCCLDPTSPFCMAGFVSGCSREEWEIMYRSQGVLEKPWGYQGFFLVNNVNSPDSPFKFGYAAVIESAKFPVSQNRHVHPRSGEIVAIYTEKFNSCTIELNGEEIKLPGNFGVVYFPPGLPHNLIFDGPAVTIDVKSLAFRDREDGLPETYRVSGVASASIYPLGICIYDPVYDINYWFGNVSIYPQALEEPIIAGFTKNPLLNWVLIRFDPIGIQMKPDQIPVYEVVEISNLGDIKELVKDPNKDSIFFAYPTVDIRRGIRDVNNVNFKK